MDLHDIIATTLEEWGVPFTKVNWPARSKKVSSEREGYTLYDYVINKTVFEPEWFEGGYGRIQIVITPWVEESKIYVRTYFEEPYEKMTHRFGKCGWIEKFYDLHDPRSLDGLRMEVDRWRCDE